MPPMCVMQMKTQSLAHVSTTPVKIHFFCIDLYLLERSGRTPGLPFLWAELGGESSQSLDELQVVQHLHHAAEVLCAGEGKATPINHWCMEIQSRKHSIWPQ